MHIEVEYGNSYAYFIKVTVSLCEEYNGICIVLLIINTTNMLLVSVRHKFRSANKIDRNPDKLTNRDAFMKRLTYSQRCDMTSGGLFAVGKVLF